MRKWIEPVLKNGIEPFLNQVFLRSLEKQFEATYSLHAKIMSFTLSALYVFVVAFVLPVYWLFPIHVFPRLQSLWINGFSYPWIDLFIMVSTLGIYFFTILFLTNGIFYLVRWGSGITVHMYYSYTINHKSKEIERHNISGYFGDKKRLFAHEGYVAWVDFINFMEKHPELHDYRIFAHSIFYRYTKDFKQVETRIVGWQRIFTCIHLLRNLQVNKACSLLFQKKVTEQVLYTTYDELAEIKPYFQQTVGLYSQEMETSNAEASNVVPSLPVTVMQEVIHQVEELASPVVSSTPILATKRRSNS